MIGDQLHLDVPGPGDDPLHEHGCIAEGLEALGPGAVERFGKAGSMVNLADATTAATRRRLDHQRKADLFGVPVCLLDRVDGSATPRRDGYAGPLGEQLGTDLVAEAAHHIGIRTDEDDAEVDAELGELGPFGNEPPTHPCRIGTRRDQRSPQRLEVEVRIAGVGCSSLVDADRLVCLTHEHRCSLGSRVQCDGADVDLVLMAELPHGIDEPHRCFAPVDDRDAAEPLVHCRGH